MSEHRIAVSSCFLSNIQSFLGLRDHKIAVTVVVPKSRLGLSGNMIEKPYTLADLPPSLVGSGEILAADVHTLTGSSRKKRSELVLAIDHESINIYDIRSSKLVNSYAVSPQTVFTCPPCSVCYRRNDLETADRLTYCSVNSPKPKLLCFSEVSSKSPGLGKRISTSSFELRKANSPVVLLETLSGTKAENCSSYHRLLAVHRNGDIRCYTANLDTEEWKVNTLANEAEEEGTDTTKVEHAALLSLEQAEKSMLKDREDLSALLDDGMHPGNTYVLCLFTRSAERDGVLKLQLHAVKTVQAGSVDTAASMGGKPIQEIFSLSIPQPDIVRRSSSTLALHAASGTLYQYSSKNLAVYNLNGLVASLAHHTDLGQSQVLTCLRISPSLVALNTVASVSIVDTKYRSLQAECSLRAQRNGQSADRSFEKQRNKTDEGTGTRLLSYFAPLDLVVAIQGRRLIGIQLLTLAAQEGGARKRKRDGLLANSIGRGIAPTQQRATKHKSLKNIPKALGNYLPSSRSDEDWSKQKASLNDHIAKGETKEFETLMIAELGIVTDEHPDDPAKRPQERTCAQHKVHYLLSKIFSTDTQSPSPEGDDAPKQLKIKFFPRGIFPYLLRKGVFSVDRIETSLKHHGVLPLTDRIASGALVNALAEWDPSLKTLLSLLESPVPLTAQELVYSLRISLNHTRAAENTEDTKLITNGGQQNNDGSDHSMHLTNGDLPSRPDSQFSNADITSTAHQLLHRILTRLLLYSPKDISRSLRKSLPPPLLLHLIDHLRMSLARAGWLTSYTEPVPSFPADQNPNVDEKHENTQISTTADLLNCLLDAIGSAGWLLGTSNSETSESANTIAYMKAEISAALEGVEEATYLRGMLGEVLAYAQSYSTSITKRESERPSRQQGTISTVTIGAGDSTDGLTMRNVLPLGLKADQGVGLRKVGAGGEVMVRSMREVGRLKDRRVPRYRVERIVI